ncbi:toxin-antitoxin system HicB family antitoxin [Acinetobacter sp. ANC 3781]|jgi:predicted HicB family RNase H-like nuclease|uniref:toxin-antitoxin system HicB family antitoxin n=1 Tax=Acinetobacter sp. ANC 3781 TaxID=2529835 RepID=UPI001038D33B|nr:toxin-antitoxin system HicB family antitoxin [Acinetobacter sp. ANC 3781]TCB78903.1 toxin-antitoxin system HicB family antitoxin [Acinetobacter sp. ANC 3781]
MATQESQKEVQISFRTTPETKRLARVEAAKQDMSLNEWIKHLVESKLVEDSSQKSKSS